MTFVEEKWRAISDSQLGWKPLRGRWNGWEQINSDTLTGYIANVPDNTSRRFDASQTKGSAASAVAAFLHDLDVLHESIAAIKSGNDDKTSDIVCHQCGTKRSRLGDWSFVRRSSTFISFHSLVEGGSWIPQPVFVLHLSYATHCSLMLIRSSEVSGDAACHQRDTYPGCACAGPACGRRDLRRTPARIWLDRRAGAGSAWLCCDNSGQINPRLNGLTCVRQKTCLGRLQRRRPEIS